jgi:hypothetical protein
MLGRGRGSTNFALRNEMRVRILRKLADWLDGVDLTHCDVGEVIDLPEHDGALVVAENWAVFARRQEDALARRFAGNPTGSAYHVGNDIYQRLKFTREAMTPQRRTRRRRATDDARPLDIEP